LIAKLTGRFDSAGDGHVVIDVGGVGYLVFCSARTLARMQQGDTVVVLVETQVRDDGIYLYGFLDAAERHWFRLLIGIQGVGPRVALAIQSVVAPHDLMLAVAAGDKAVLMRAAGVGAKLAARITSELKDKVAAISTLDETQQAAMVAPQGGPAADAISALINLGFRPVEASAAVGSAAGRLGTGAAVEALIRGGLAELASKEPGKEQR
jgi:Holliday junction DNA helicase RuvA